MEQPLTSPDLNLIENILKGSKEKNKRYSLLITNEKDIFETALKRMREFIREKRSCKID